MNKVAVLLSSYNGEKFIEEQILSILQQENVKIKLFIRDDYSKDNTQEILKKISKQYSNIFLMLGDENLGYKKGFKYLIDYLYNSDEEYDYVSFADQDDYWEIDKLDRSIQMIEKNKVICYSSNLKVVDKNLKNPDFKYKNNDYIPKNFKEELINGYAYGCTIVLPKKSFFKIANFNGGNTYPFDFYIPIILGMFGDTFYDKDSRILYRQHSNNVIGANSSLKYLINTVKKKYKNNYYSEFARLLLKNYSEVIDRKEKDILISFASNKYNANKFRLIKDKYVRKFTLKGTVLLKLMIVLNKF